MESEDENVVDEVEEVVIHADEVNDKFSQSSTKKKSKVSLNETAEVNFEPLSSSRSSSAYRSSTGRKSKQNEAAVLDVDAAITRLENLNKEVITVVVLIYKYSILKRN